MFWKKFAFGHRCAGAWPSGGIKIKENKILLYLINVIWERHEKKKNIFNPVTLLQFDLKYYMCILICKSYSYCLAWNKDVNYRKTKLKPGVKKSNRK